jgi:ArsR family transcriptional regulator, arsenate/arsenite/antimonite-responsive transcriptional repressor
VVDELEQHADRLGALGHPVRLRIVRFVVEAGREGASAAPLMSAFLRAKKP